ncbi:DUF6089 family protein [Belliella sp. R4-6]|uniref:DUF6089 family protein n=1 Tax=Belliella alkalica TaxID=1730871 RepID=A0ABS9VG08_9BACT|nr:DUF6089 family protein [Belliella alkalica]MCH7415381.1 DUF6089 family protein [Belliella alkalica]
MFITQKTYWPLLIIFVLILVSEEGKGQSFYEYKVPVEHSIIIGAGPSFIYADNGGIYSKLKFKLNPSISAAYSKKLNRSFDLRANIGHQQIEGLKSTNATILEMWESRSSAYNFSGRVNYLDIMPVFNVFPADHAYLRTGFNIYGGLGLGILMSKVDLEYENRIVEDHKTVTMYIPGRAGISYKLNDKTDIMLEGSLLFSFSDNIDGNENFNRLDDHLWQVQVMLKRYLKPSKLW